MGCYGPHSFPGIPSRVTTELQSRYHVGWSQLAVPVSRIPSIFANSASALGKLLIDLKHRSIIHSRTFFRLCPDLRQALENLWGHLPLEIGSFMNRNHEQPLQKSHRTGATKSVGLQSNSCENHRSQRRLGALSISRLFISSAKPHIIVFAASCVISS